jgi:uncharacterized protein YjbI with pentapeptide repeats
MTGITVVEGATNPEIKDGTRYEYCDFEGVALDGIVFDNIVFYNCTFITCKFNFVCWYKCEWLSCYLHDVDVQNCTFAKCELEWNLNYSSIIDSIALESELNITKTQSTIKFIA